MQRYQPFTPPEVIFNYAEPNVELDNVELANVVALNGSSLSSIFTLKQDDDSNFPDEVRMPFFSTANSWFIASIHQSNFSDHLQKHHPLLLLRMVSHCI